MRMLVLAALTTLTACGSSSSTVTPAPASCDPGTERSGSYRVHYTYETGTCGPLEDNVVVIAPAASGGNDPNGCTLNAEVFSTNGCKIDRDITCPNPAGGTIRFQGSTTQQTENGSVLSGIMSITLVGPSDCYGTYDITYTRQ